MVTKRFILVVSAVMLALLAASISVSAAEKVKLTYMTWWGETDERSKVDRAIVDAYLKTKPDLEIVSIKSNWDQIVTQMAAGLKPDIAIVEPAWIAGMIRGDMATDLTPLVGADRFDLEAFRPGYLQENQWNGKLYGLTWNASNMVLVYNRTLYAEAGLVFPYAGWSLQDFRANIQKLSNPEKQRWGFNWPSVATSASNVILFPLLYANGGKLIDPQTQRATFDQPELVNTLEWLADLNINKTDWIDRTSKAMLDGHVGMWYSWEGPLSNYILADRLHEKFDWGVAYNPRGTAEPVTLQKGLSMVLLTSSQHPKEAWEFIKYYFSREAQDIRAAALLVPSTIYGTIQAARRVTQYLPGYDINRIYGPIMEPTRNIVSMPFLIPGAVDALQLAGRAFVSALQGQKAPLVAVQEVVPAFNKILEEAKQK